MPYDPVAYAEPIIRSEPLTVEELLATPDALRLWVACKSPHEVVGICRAPFGCLLASWLAATVGGYWGVDGEDLDRWANSDMEGDGRVYQTPAWAKPVIVAFDAAGDWDEAITASTALRILSEVTGG